MHADEAIPKMLPWLVHFAITGDTVTYGELKVLAKLTTHHLGKWLDPLSVICKANSIPLLNSLVVEPGTKMPGAGYFGTVDQQKRLNDDLKETQKNQREVYKFAKDHPGKLRQFLKRQKCEDIDALNEPVAVSAKRAFRQLQGARGESERHRALRLYLEAKPWVLELNGTGKTEYELPTGQDRCDVVVTGGRVSAAIEVRRATTSASFAWASSRQ
jgi:hypothetical protein